MKAEIVFFFKSNREKLIFQIKPKRYSENSTANFIEKVCAGDLPKTHFFGLSNNLFNSLFFTELKPSEIIDVSIIVLQNIPALSVLRLLEIKEKPFDEFDCLFWAFPR